MGREEHKEPKGAESQLNLQFTNIIPCKGQNPLYLCDTCGEWKPIGAMGKYPHRNNHVSRHCKTCKNKAEKEKRYTKTGRSGYIFSRVKSRAKKKGLAFDLTLSFISERLKRIDFKCEITSIPFALDSTNNGGPKWNTLSVDQIIPGQGYTQENVRFILHSLNMALQKMSDKEFGILAKKFLAYLNNTIS